MRELLESIEEAVSVCTGGCNESPTWVMFELMNIIDDEDIERWGIDLADVANEVLKHIEGKRY